MHSPFSMLYTALNGKKYDTSSFSRTDQFHLLWLFQQYLITDDPNEFQHRTAPATIEITKTTQPGYSHQLSASNLFGIQMDLVRKKFAETELTDLVEA